ncbi:autotransporter outer membrane beta-barrel domain-containing protein [Sebaldella sp. S0638]|uniref:autotransporter outer membrane beta-barrel domain-containing protein n=1 Tax=Sebaldella sp. S0638 TaxID=2957809 RepID=UPI0020A125F2|nr:autotransporter outer membrane beta-barrel domain-containing protein [Sebaldella sp. S0638]MCP1226405.1 autotransporter outer membrane beta-barrel domain-containing protein [Sebaldella sp. S0638]
MKKYALLLLFLSKILVSTNIYFNIDTEILNSQITNETYNYNNSSITLTNNGTMLDNDTLFYLIFNSDPNNSFINNGIIKTNINGQFGINSVNSNFRFINNNKIEINGTDNYFGVVGGLFGESLINSENSETGTIIIRQDSTGITNGFTDISAIYFLEGDFTNKGKIDVIGDFSLVDFLVKEISVVGIYGEFLNPSGSVKNFGNIDVQNLNSINGIAGIGVKGNANVINNGKISINHSIVQGSLNEGVNIFGIGVDDSNMSSFVNILNDKSGIIEINSDNAAGIGIHFLNDTTDLINLINNGEIIINSDNSKGIAGYKDFLLENNGTITLNGRNNEGIDTYSQNFKNNGIINVNGQNSYGVYIGAGRDFYTTKIYNQEFNNEGIINVNGFQNYGIYSVSVGEIKNLGTINVIEGTGVKIETGNFYNKGVISAFKNIAVEMNNESNSLELASGTLITGKIDGLMGEDELILSGTGNINVESVFNFEKLVVAGDILLDGIINLGVSDLSNYTNSAYLKTSSYSFKDADGASGNLMLKGTIYIDVDYSGITASGTEKTGKIVANSINLNGGQIILKNKDSISNSLIDEFEKNNPDLKEFRIKSIATIKNHQVIIPNLFFLSPFMDVKDSANMYTWKTMTIGDRIGEGNSLLVDQLYYKSKVPLNILLPRNRVDLDNINSLSEKQINSIENYGKDLKIGEQNVEINYQGVGFNSDYRSDYNYNYDYNVNSNGIIGIITNKLSNNFLVSLGLSYNKSSIKYESINVSKQKLNSNSKENLESYGLNLITKYYFNNFNLNGFISYGLNRHDITTEFFGLGNKNGIYNSHILKAGVFSSYDYNPFNILKFSPFIGIEYISLYENELQYDLSPEYETLKLNDTNGEGFTGSVGFKIKENIGKFRWNLGFEYRYNFTNTFHKERKFETDYIKLKMEELKYENGEFSANINTSYNLNDRVNFNLGYSYRFNENYKNQVITGGFTVNIDN